MATGAVTVTEGLVEEFSPQRRNHQSRETFRIGDVLREGMPVRIHSIDGQILRLDADTTRPYFPNACTHTFLNRTGCP